MTAIQLLLGTVMIAAALHDMFHTLFHPSGRGALSEWISFRIWRVWRRIFGPRHHWLSLAGPLSFIAIVGAWATLIVVGFAFIYHPFLASRFVMAQGLDIKAHHSFFDSINVSLGSLITVTGDFNTGSHWLRLAMGVEAVMGFVLLTSSLSWVLSIYPVLEYRRSAAHRLSLLHHAHQIERLGISSMPERQTEELVMALIVDMTKIRNDLAQFPITYYFHEDEPQSAFPGALPLMADIASRAIRAESTEPVRVAGLVLQGAIHDFLCLVGSWYLHIPNERNDSKLLEAFAKDHFRDELRSA